MDSDGSHVSQRYKRITVYLWDATVKLSMILRAEIMLPLNYYHSMLQAKFVSNPTR